MRRFMEGATGKPVKTKVTWPLLFGFLKDAFFCIEGKMLVDKRRKKMAFWCKRHGTMLYAEWFKLTKDDVSGIDRILFLPGFFEQLMEPMKFHGPKTSVPGTRWTRRHQVQGLLNMGVRQKLCFFFKQKWFWSTEMKQDLPIIWRSVKKCLVFLHFYHIFCIYICQKLSPQKFNIQHPMTFNDVRYGLPWWKFYRIPWWMIHMNRGCRHWCCCCCCCCWISTRYNENGFTLFWHWLGCISM